MQTDLDRVTKSGMVKTFPASDECHYVGKTDEKELRCLSNGQSELLKKRLDIIIKGNDIPAPISSFSSCGLPEKLQHNLESAGFDMPTPVQMQAIPAAMARKSLLVSAETAMGLFINNRAPFLCIALLVVLLRSPTPANTAKTRLLGTSVNEIDRCWRRMPNWASNRHSLATCSIGFSGKMTNNIGKGMVDYVVTDPSDDPLGPKPGTLRLGPA
ncbi:hypothetical protein MLD38_026268 [Melastoma candidum]|uniref:Uncharacterized protein n=1 Tax=Melastoma candidum TaxID=119954 RepID=A0ACB9NZM1_9MYRT|nr:hypothetical protein MLD38_026268 [Melastoma candidum]